MFQQQHFSQPKYLHNFEFVTMLPQFTIRIIMKEKKEKDLVKQLKKTKDPSS
jgi:hypothetical protein